jgi:hypothetical protein
MSGYDVYYGPLRWTHVYGVSGWKRIDSARHNLAEVEAEMRFPIEHVIMTGPHKRPHNPRFPKRARRSVQFSHRFPAR